MGFQDTLNYVLFTNPVASGLTSCVWNTVSTVPRYLGLQPTAVTSMPVVPLWKLASAAGPYVRLAGLSGAIAVAVGAHGSHMTYPESEHQELKRVFETGSRYHFIHTLAMLGLPMCRTPSLAATFFVSGIVLFCGTCYYHAFTGDKQYSKLTPVGGVCFIIGWLSMCI